MESTTRPDGARMIAGIPVTEDQWWEKCPIFRALNTNKKSVTVDFQTERGLELLKKLIATSDVIVENYTPRVLDQIGLDYDAGPGAAPRHRHGAHAGFRPDRPDAGQPGVRLRHRGRGRPHLADRVPRRQPGRAVLARRPERRPARAQRPAARAGAPAPHRGGRPGGSGHGGGGHQHRRRAADRVLRVRRPAAAGRQPGAAGGAAEPVPVGRHRRVRPRGRVGRRRGRHRRAVGRAGRRPRPPGLGRPTRNCPPRRAAGPGTT